MIKGSRDNLLKKFKSVLAEQYRTDNQHCVHEFICYLETQLEKPFACFKTTRCNLMVCEQCGVKQYRRILTNELPICIPGSQNLPSHAKNVEEHVWSLRGWILNQFMQQETLERNCSNCSCKKSNARLHHLGSAPEILRITLIYHEFDASSAESAKPVRRWTDFDTIEVNVIARSSKVDANVGQEAAEVFVDEVEVECASEVRCTYRLYGIIFHHGNSTKGGHYTFAGCGSGCAGNESCDGQVIKDGIISVCEPAWWHVNDDEVYGPVSRDMAHAHAMGMSSPILSGGKPVIGNQVHAPYILLYIRLADPDIGLEPSTFQCSFCTKGHAWRSTFRWHQILIAHLDINFLLVYALRRTHGPAPASEQT